MELARLALGLPWGVLLQQTLAKLAEACWHEGWTGADEPCADDAGELPVGLPAGMLAKMRSSCSVLNRSRKPLPWRMVMWWWCAVIPDSRPNFAC